MSTISSPIDRSVERNTNSGDAATGSVSSAHANGYGEELILLDRCKAGDKDAWNDLVRKHEKPVFSTAFKLCGNHDDAADVSNQVFVRVFRNLHLFRNDARFSSWLYRIVRNTYMDMCVRPAHTNNISLDSEYTDGNGTTRLQDLQDPRHTPEAQCIRNDIARLIATEVHQLPEYQQEVLKMYHSEGRSYDEIATATGLSVGTVKSRLFRARNLLRMRLAPLHESHVLC